AFQFILTLYLQQLRGWSALESGFAIFPAGLIVALLSPRLAPLVGRFGVHRLILVGMTLLVPAYALFLRVGLHSGYAGAMLPTFLIAGLGFGLAFGPLNIAGTNGIAHPVQGLAGGLLNTSFQFGGALFLAVATAVHNANVGSDGSAQALLNGFHAALVVSVIAGTLGVAFIGLRRPRRTEEVIEVAPLTDEDV